MGRPEYGHRHRLVRAALLARLRDGEAMACTRCGQPLDPAAPDRAFHLDHDEDDPSRATYRGLSHAACNIAAPGVRGAAADSVARYRGVPGADPNPPAQCVGMADHHALWAGGGLASQRPGPAQMACRGGGHVAAWLVDEEEQAPVVDRARPVAY